jgi:hypothetical protein
MPMFLLKWLLVFGLLAAGTVFLLTGLGMEVPAIKFQGFEGQRVPTGVVLLIAGIALAAFWRVTITTSVKETKPDGTSRETTRVAKGIVEPLAEFVQKKARAALKKGAHTGKTEK